jgi:hypothetical protein
MPRAYGILEAFPCFYRPVTIIDASHKYSTPKQYCDFRYPQDSRFFLFLCMLPDAYKHRFAKAWCAQLRKPSYKYDI